VKSAPPPDRVPFRAILALSFGSLGSCYVLFSINNLAFPIYNLALGVSAVKLGWAMALPRVIDAFFDPLIGWLSDNTRSRWGRRKPYIVAGAFPLALFTVLLWLPPSKAGPDVIFWYFLVISIFYYLAYSVCVVPLSALGFELSNDYNERTRIMGWGSIIALLGGLSTPWLYKLTLLPVFGGDEVAGVRWIGGGHFLHHHRPGNLLPGALSRRGAPEGRTARIGRADPGQRPFSARDRRHPRRGRRHLHGRAMPPLCEHL